jgi:mRNA-degrading endonuclease toxin of MazEF toxin-antitoxin module
MRRGEVWRVRLPPAPGHAQSGDRPALVVQNDAFMAALPTVLVVPFRGERRPSRWPSNCEPSINGTACIGSVKWMR